MSVKLAREILRASPLAAVLASCFNIAPQTTPYTPNLPQFSVQFSSDLWFLSQILYVPVARLVVTLCSAAISSELHGGTLFTCHH